MTRDPHLPRIDNRCDNCCRSFPKVYVIGGKQRCYRCLKADIRDAAEKAGIAVRQKRSEL